MQLSVSGRHLNITDSMKGYAEEKTGKLTRFYDRIESIDVVLDHSAAGYGVEIVCRADHKHTFVAHTEAGDFYEAVDLASDKMARQLSRHKERFRNRKHTVSPDHAGHPGTSDAGRDQREGRSL